MITIAIKLKENRTMDKEQLILALAQQVMYLAKNTKNDFLAQSLIVDEIKKLLEIIDNEK